MCGIVGLSGGRLARLEAGNARLGHRGPDDSGEFRDTQAGIGLGHRRLSIIDLTPSGHQPMASPDGQVVLVYNGEIYNFRELRDALPGGGRGLLGTSDTEVLLHLYLAKGAGMLAELNGIFSLAIWDARSGELLLARDALGVKPLYYAEHDGAFAFASEIKALLELMPELRVLDHRSLDRYLTFLWCPGPGTPLSAVRKLEPGWAMTIAKGRVVKRWQWYSLPQKAGRAGWIPEARTASAVEEALRTAVQRQMVSDVPVGAFLSGGLDSSAVVAFGRELDPGLRCFTIDAGGGPEVGMADDLPYARRVARHLQVPLEVIRIDASRMAGDFEAMVAQLDEPLADPAPLNVLYISRLARDHGIKVLLSGAGGDDLFTGYRRHRAIRMERYWRWLPRDVKALMKGAAESLDQRGALGRRARKLFNGALLEGNEAIVNYFRWADRSLLHSLYRPDFRASVLEGRAEDPMLEFLAELPSNLGPLDRMLALEQRFFLADHNLTYTDKMSMAASVEVRVPFLDLDLVRLANSIPVGMKQRGSVGKWVLKKAMEPYLPQEVIYRPKSGFGAPVRHWIRFELREMLGEVLSPDSLNRRGLFDAEAIQRLVSTNDQGQVDASYTLLSLMGIELWCRAYLDRPVG